MGLYARGSESSKQLNEERAEKNFRELLKWASEYSVRAFVDVYVITILTFTLTSSLRLLFVRVARLFCLNASDINAPGVLLYIYFNVNELYIRMNVIRKS